MESMIYVPYNWYGVDIEKLPNAQKRWLKYYRMDGTKKRQLKTTISEEMWTVEIDDIHEFVKNFKGAVQLVAPTDMFPHWSIYLSTKSTFRY
jgi:hypothetical protein